MIVDVPALLAIQARTQAATRAVRLPLRNRKWSGLHGSWGGAGSGSSIDFHDHRAYLPGDDPRYLDWQAYARSSHYTMKLYREEVSPSIDIALDLSESMVFEPAKATRTLELFYFALASALQSRGTIHLFLHSGEGITPLALNAALSPAAFLEAATALGEKPSLSPLPRLEKIPWRAGSLRVWISDLLFPGPPLLLPLAAGKGRGVLLSPWCQTEGEPEWDGNLDFIDCETTQKRPQRIDTELLSRYRAAYERHFALWRTEAHRYGVAFAKVAAEPDFLAALRVEALPTGAIEVA